MNETSHGKLLKTTCGVVTLLLALGAVSPALAVPNPLRRAIRLIRGTGVQKPPAGEFGLGPRASAHGRYVATLTPDRQLRPRRMLSVRVTVMDGNGRPVSDASLTIAGGMPEHGHGLPSRPRVTRNLGEGSYEIEGVRFNMGGWWEFKVSIEAGGLADTITFNLGL
ncbi:MAG: FixH family protein [Bryobacteraceae bacterium]|nr:FixH family protein [Bryobacteraceae bacterium]